MSVIRMGTSKREDRAFQSKNGHWDGDPRRGRSRYLLGLAFQRVFDIPEYGGSHLRGSSGPQSNDGLRIRFVNDFMERRGNRFGSNDY